jgi:hypothetical protein
VIATRVEVFRYRAEILLRRVIQDLNPLIAGFRPHSLYPRQSFEHALDALLATLSSDGLGTDDFKRQGLQHSISNHARAGCGA